MSIKKLAVSAVAAGLLLSAGTVWAQDGKSPIAVYVKGGNKAVNAMLGKPIETVFTSSGKFDAGRSKGFLGEASKRKGATDSDIAELGRKHGIRFVCVIDASNVKVIPRPSGSAAISLFDVNAGRTLGQPQTIAVPPPNIQEVGKKLLDLALSAAADAVVAGVQSGVDGEMSVSREGSDQRDKKDPGRSRHIIAALITVACAIVMLLAVAAVDQSL